MALPGPFNALFHCTYSLAPTENYPENPAPPISKEYRWMEIQEVSELIQEDDAPWAGEACVYSHLVTLWREISGKVRT